MRVKTKNQLSFLMFCTVIGGAAGGVIWLFLKIMTLGTGFLWEWLPERLAIPYYPVIICTLGGILVGLFRRKYGDYPEELKDVLGKVKRDKYYGYDNMLVMIIAALLPLLMGASIGPEAGMTGIIVGLCYWVGDNLKFAKKYAREYSEVGVAVTLGVLFHAPLFGVFEVVESSDADENIVLPKTSKILIYSVSLAGGMGVYLLLTSLFGKVLGGMPSFSLEGGLKPTDYAMTPVYVLAGCLLAWFYEITHKGAQKITSMIPGGLREAVGGLCLGIVGMLVPVIMFSGEEAMGELPENFGMYIPLMWMAIGVLKILLTNICIQSGLKGGHFFPIIFAGVSFAYGMAGAVFSSDGHEVFAAAVVTAALLGGTLKKPLAVTMLMILCFPPRLCIWILVAAVISSKLISIGRHDGGNLAVGEDIA